MYTGWDVDVADGPGAGCSYLMCFRVTKTRRLVRYVANLMRIGRVLPGSFGPTRCMRSTSSTVSGGRSAEFITLSVSSSTSSPSRSGIPEMRRELHLEYCSRASAFSSRSTTRSRRSAICLSLAPTILLRSATSCLSSLTRISLSLFATLGSHSASKRPDEKSTSFSVAVNDPLD